MDEFKNDETIVDVSEPETENQSNGLAIASLVLGILSIIMGCCTGYLGIILGIIGIILAIVSRHSTKKFSGIALAGLICSIFGVVIGILMIVLSVASLAFISSDGFGLENDIDIDF